MATNVSELLPPNLRSPFWIQFAEAVSEELQRFKTHVQEKEIFYDVSTLDDKQQLIDLARSLGYTPDLSLDDSLENIKDNVNSVTFRIQNKTTYLSYQYIFKTVPYTGQVYILYYEDNKLQRAVISLLQMLSELGTSAQPYTEPFIYQAEENYSEFLFSELFLDTGLSLDSSSRPWALDEFSSSSKTNHMAIEYSLERVITQDGEEYLMTPDYLGYLFNAVDYTRKVTEVPHIGSHLSLIMDNSGFYDSATGGDEDYSTPKLKTRAAVTDQYVNEDPASEVHRMVAGTGSQDLPSINDDNPQWPTELDNKVVDTVLVTNETEEIEDWKIINSMLPANTVTNELLGTGDNEVFESSGTLNVEGVKPYSVRIHFVSTPDEYTIIDDGQENLFIEDQEDYPVGSIDYDTGEYEFSTSKREDVELEVLSQVSTESIDLNLDHQLVTPNSFTLYFTIGETGYAKSDDGGGGFTDTSTGIIAGEIDYDSGTVSATFQDKTRAREDDATEHGNKEGGVTAEYSFTREYEVDSDSDVTIDYEVENPLPLTEAGIEDSDGNLLAYATFPPIAMDNVRYHASFQFLIRKENF